MASTSGPNADYLAFDARSFSIAVMTRRHTRAPCGALACRRAVKGDAGSHRVASFSAAGATMEPEGHLVPP
jgi:hypothetical protein